MTHSELLTQLRDSDDNLGGSPKGSLTTRCYQVQARMCKGCDPKQLTANDYFGGKFLTDTKWQTIYFPKSKIGVPASPFDEEYTRHGYLSYPAAQALRWWFIAEQGGFSAIETRLVEYEFKSSYSAEPKRAICMVDPEQREDIMPDWGKKETAPNAT